MDTTSVMEQTAEGLQVEYGRSYQELKQELQMELVAAGESFVKIGYLLKVARDTTILRDSGYATVTEFAQAEYGLDKSQVSRFIQVYDRYGDGQGQLRAHYKNFGLAKLVIMLQLPDSLNEELTPDFTKAEIQSIKEEVDEESAKTDIEVILEGETPATEIMDTNMEKTIKQLGQDDPELFRDIYKVMHESPEIWDVAFLQSTMAPSGQKLYSVRIRGIGRKELVLKDRDNGNTAVLIDLRSGEKEEITWEEVLKAWEKLINPSMEGQSVERTPEHYWEEIYFTEWPIKEKVAPVQPQKAAAVEKTKKESKVQKAPKPEKPSTESTEPVEEQLPGQTSIEKDFPEYMPEPVEETEQDNAENAQIDTKNENIEQQEKSRTQIEYEETVTNNLNTLMNVWNGTKPDKIHFMLELVRDLKWGLEKIQEITEAEEKDE